MSLPPITLECLGAGYGDCLLITCPVRRGTWRLLVDTGPDETWPALKARLAALPTNRAGKRHIDLAIITHIDHDHIGAAQLVFSDRELNLSFGDVWFNARTHLGVRGVAEGQGLGELLGDSAQGLPWNRAFDGLAVVTPGKGRFREATLAKGLPRITVLSPSPDRLTAPSPEPGTRRWSVCGAESGTPRRQRLYLAVRHSPLSKRWQRGSV